MHKLTSENQKELKKLQKVSKKKSRKKKRKKNSKIIFQKKSQVRTNLARPQPGPTRPDPTRPDPTWPQPTFQRLRPFSFAKIHRSETEVRFSHTKKIK